MTEEEARQKSCPMRLDVNTTYGKCVGSECMAWVECFEEWDESNGVGGVNHYKQKTGGCCGMVK